MTDVVVPAPRERGWTQLILALVAFLLIPGTPLLPTLLPIERTLVLLVPAMAACALAGWRAGGRFWLAVVWVALAAMVLSRPWPASTPSFDTLTRAWSLMLAAAFGLVSVLGGPRRFLGRALTALVMAGSIAAVSLAVVRAAPTRVQRTVAIELEARAEKEVTNWRRAFGTPEMRKRLAASPSTDSMVQQMQQEIAMLPEASTAAFPAVLALESLAALALAWALYHRVSRARIGAPLAPLREFRFNDQLVWGVIAGLTMVLLPTLANLRGVGANLLVFFGALYVLRGAGVAAFFMAPGWITALMLTIFALLFGPFLAVGALGLGLGDTWLDWRTRRARPTS